MDKERIILKYAQAIAAYAQEAGVLDKVLKNYQDIKDFLWDSFEARAYLLFPGIAIGEKRELLLRCKEHLGLDEGFLRFFFLLLEEGRFSLFSAVYEKFKAFADAYKKELTVRVTSAYPLSQQQEQDISKTLEEAFKRKLVIEKTVDHSILGGIDIFLVGQDLKINLSLKSMLERLKTAVLR